MSDGYLTIFAIMPKEIYVNVNMKCHKNFKVKMSQFLKYE